MSRSKSGVKPRALVKRLLARYFSFVVTNGRRSGAARLCLTFDDGPHPDHTPCILDILNAKGARATFFVSGEEVSKYPELVRRMVEGGHQVGNHGYHHLRARDTGTREYVRDIQACQDLLDGLSASHAGKAFRPPYGSVAPISFALLLIMGYRFILWSADSEDSYIGDARGLVDKIKGMDLSNGEILLMHEDYKHTVEALPSVIEHIQGRGMELVRVCDI